MAGIIDRFRSSDLQGQAIAFPGRFQIGPVVAVRRLRIDLCLDGSNAKSLEQARNLLLAHRFARLGVVGGPRLGVERHQ
jgi:hypothetical protein